ncbi:MAG: PQQ-binding-like beta-propeller repeat protein [Acidobacteriia bacterium]|nr:PQQ-binding-like beta-propeller repeat protein [Terriglobia bacterium]
MRYSLLFIAAVSFGQNWPQWRGPSADGISTEKNLPLRWSKTENIAWRAPLEGLGTSTPIVWGDRVFITSQLGDGPFEGRSRDFDNAAVARRTGERPKPQFAVQAFDRRSGKLLWDYRLDADGALQPVHIKHNLASPSCITDGERLYAWFGTGQLVTLDLTGKLIWKRHLGKEIAPFDVLWGHGSSPALYKESLFLLCDHPPGAYLVSLDKRTGKERWRKDRGKEKRSYTTPFVVSLAGHDELILNSSQRVDAVDPTTGELLWWAGEPNRVPVPTPVFHDGVLYLNRGYSSSPYLALKPGGRGDATSRIQWEVKTGGPYVSSLLYYQGLLYMANETGIVSTSDAATGKTLWKDRFGSVFSASPVAGDGKVYLVNEEGVTFVLAAGKEKKVLAENALEERILASPAISGGMLFFRSDQSLICVRAARP